MDDPDRDDVLRRIDVEDDEWVRDGIKPLFVRAVFEDEVEGVRRLALTV